jgi:transglutaminase-like putative cysteine protease
VTGKERKRKKIGKTRTTSLSNFSLWLGNWWDWISVLLVFVTLEIAILSIEQAKWIKSQPSLTLTLTIAVLTGLFLAKKRLFGVLKWFLVIILGAGVTIWQASSLIPEAEISSRIKQLFIALQSWWQTTTMAQPSEGTIHFAVFLIFFTWILGYISVWFILRRQNAWVVVALGTITILVNLSNLPNTYYGFFFFYLVAAMLLIGQTRLVKHYYQSTQDGSNYPNRGMAYFLISVFCLSILATSVAWFTPDIRVSQLEAAIGTKIPGQKSISEHLTNFFANVPRKQTIFKSDEQTEFSFDDVCESTENDVHFIITSDIPQYWLTHAYDFYTSSGWINSNTVDYPAGRKAADIESDSPAGRREITYTVETQITTDIILDAGEFISSNTPALLKVITPMSSDITVEQMTMDNTVAVVTPYSLKPNQRYTVTASIISATPDELANAGDDYPSWITTYYLQLPPNLPERIKQLTDEVTQNALTPYDKTLAIGNYVSQFSYDMYAEPPSKASDGVDNFLFAQQSGTCGDFASAMTVMLRAAGVPARFCVGYLTGEWDSNTESYLILAKNRHAWAEVYFPGYGWVEFEATPRAGNVMGLVGVEMMGEYDMWDRWGIMGGWDESTYIPSGIGTTGTTSVKTTSPTWLWPIILLIIGAIILVIVLFFTLRSTFSRRIWKLEGREYGTEVYIYTRMCEIAALVKLGPKPQQTPLEYCAQLASEFPQHANAINTIAQAFLERQFGRKETITQPLQWELYKSRRSVYDALLERLPRRRW